MELVYERTLDYIWLFYGCGAQNLLQIICLLKCLITITATMSSQLVNWKTWSSCRQLLKTVFPYYSGVKLFASKIPTYLGLESTTISWLPAHMTNLWWRKRSCCSGSVGRSPLKVFDPSAAVIPTITKKHSFIICLQKSFDNMKVMYNQFIPPELRPDYLPPFVSSVSLLWQAKCNKIPYH